MGPETARRNAAFTLIEMLAVVALMALMAAFVIPNIGSLQNRRLHAQARELAAQFELARQRSVVTGIPHRLWMDLDAGVYRLEWLVTEAQASGEPEKTVAFDPASEAPLPLSAPRASQREYRPLPGRLGRDHGLQDAFDFAGIDTPQGWIDGGDAFVAFDRDGTSAAASVVIDNESGHRVTLHVLPLAEAVRIREEDS